MLKELKIEGYKLLKDIQIQPHPGFNVITGETGAGKSLILGALKFLLGSKGGDEIFAKGEDTVRVSAVFAIPGDHSTRQKFIDNGLMDISEDEIFIERTKERDGKSRIFAGGRRVNQPVIREIQESLVDFLEQHQASRLAERSALDVLDSLGDSQHRELMSNVQEKHAGWTQIKEDLHLREKRIRELRERRDLIEFQLKELSDANLMPGELDDLNRELQILGQAKDLRENAWNASKILTGNESESMGVQDMLSNVFELIEPLAAIDPGWAEKLDELKNTEDVIREISRELVMASDSIQDNPERLVQVEHRIGLVEKLKRKYRCDFAGLLEFREKLSSDFETISLSDSDLAKLRLSVESAKQRCIEESEKLSQSRKKLAKLIEKELFRHLKDLDLPNAKVSFRFEKDSEIKLTPGGFDRIEIMLTTNPSEDMRPLREVASGGESTRISLALKALWAEREGVPMLVLDEGDIGIGGDTAYQVGEKFRDLAQSHQLIVVSHLAQVAAYSDRHFRVRKSESKNSAEIDVDVAEKDERVEELARMIGGSRDMNKSIALAKSLIKRVNSRE